VPATPTAGSTSQKVDLNKVFPPGEGRDLVLSNCVACHSFVCSVRGQRPAGHWETVKIGHRAKVPALNDADFDALFAYLTANFNDTKPEPELPEALLKIGCNVQ
jgi:mono/diheme cytochrome c family protein